MPTLIRRACGAVLALAAGLAAGCGGTSLAPVRGVVKLDGSPLADASVEFIAQDQGGRDASGFTDANGVFTISTFKPGDGAMPGKYKVVIQPTAAVEGPPAASMEEAQKGLSRARSKAPSVPEKYTRPDQTPLTQDVPPAGEVVIDLTSR
jgi:hypothetical protein